MNETILNRNEMELYLRDMTSRIIDNNMVVKSIVDDVFEEMKVECLHKRYENRDEAKTLLVSFARNSILEYMDRNSDIENYKETKDNLNYFAKKYYKYNLYFAKNKVMDFIDTDDISELIDEELDKFNTMQKEILIRRYYFFQPCEKIATSLDISLYKVYSTIRQLIKSIWSKVLTNEKIAGEDIHDIEELQAKVNEYFEALGKQNKLFAKYNVTAKEIQEYFIVKLLKNSSMAEIDIIFDDICLESMSRMQPSEEECDNLQYLSILRQYPQVSVKKRFKKSKESTKKLIFMGLCGAICLGMILFFGKGNVLAKANNKSTYKVSSKKLGLTFTYKEEGEKVNIDIDQDYYVDEEFEQDYTSKIDTELAKKVDSNNLYAEMNIVEQTVYEGSSKYLSPKDEGGQRYKQGDKKYIYSNAFNILFIAEYVDGAWECAKVIYVDKIEPTSKYHLDTNISLEDFYKDSNDGKWKCEMYNSKDGTFTEIEFESDDSEMSCLGTYEAGDMKFEKKFDINTGQLYMRQTSAISKEKYGQEFLTYMEENDNIILYHNGYEGGQLKTTVIGKVRTNVLENMANYIKECPVVILEDIKAYDLKLPGSDVYIFPTLVQKVGKIGYSSDYYEFSYYDSFEMKKKYDYELVVYQKKDGKIRRLKEVYRLYHKNSYKEENNIKNYEKCMNIQQYIYQDKEIEGYKIRIFNNLFAEVLEYNGSDTKVNIPMYIGGYEVRYIGNEAFCGNETIEEVVIPSTVQEIGKKAFNQCKKINKVVIMGEITSIGEAAYEGCEKLKKVVINTSPKYIGKQCFENTEYINTLKKKDGVIYFKNVALKLVEEKEKLVIDEKIQVIADGFIDNKGKKLSSVTLPKHVKTIGKGAFARATLLKEIKIPQTTEYVGDYAFSACTRLNEIVVPGGIKVISEGMLKDCMRLEKITIQSGVEIIKDKAFDGVSKNCKVDMPKTLKCVF